MALNGIDYAILILYLVVTVSIGLYIGRKMHSGDDYFLAGRSLPWWAIGMSLVVTDIGATDMVGIAGSAYLYGIVLGNYDWLGSVPVMIIGAFLVIPMFWKAKVSTIPEWLGARYNDGVRTTSALIWGVYLSMGLGITLYASAVMLNLLLDLNPKILVVSEAQEEFQAIVETTDAGKTHDFIQATSSEEAADAIEQHDLNLILIHSDIAGGELVPPPGDNPTVVYAVDDITTEWGETVMNQARAPDWPFMYTVILMGIIIGAYTLFGGLKAVVYTDVIQCVVMLGGALFVLVYGIYNLGGIGEFTSTIGELGERAKFHFELVVPADAGTPHPWSGIMLGLGLVLANAYWLGNQTIVQRTLGAKSMEDARASYVLGSFLKVLIPFAMVVPGIIALAYNPNITDADKAMATLVREIMPSGMLGIFFAAFLAGLMSSVDSALNSSATIWTKDIYQRFFKPDGTPLHYLVVGRILTAVFLVVAIVFAQYAMNFESIYDLTQTLLSVFQGPSLAIILLGVLWKRGTGAGALVGLIGGVAFSMTIMWANSNASEPLFKIDDPFLYIAWWSFIVSVSLTVIVSLLTKPMSDERLKGLIYHERKEAADGQ
jgi:SSS family solute:Na+ symporter